jgi:hypothetical protein
MNIARARGDSRTIIKKKAENDAFFGTTIRIYLHVMGLLRHKNIKNTLVYAQLVTSKTTITYAKPQQTSKRLRS